MSQSFTKGITIPVPAAQGGTGTAAQALLDANGNVILNYNAAASAVNYVQVSNSATGNQIGFSAVGTDPNITMEFAAKGTGVYNFAASATSPSLLNLSEQATNGANYIQIAVPAAITATRSLTLQEPSANAYITYDTTSTPVWTSWSPGWTGFSVNPTVDAYYKKIGNTCFIMINATVGGTSNATTFTITNLPFTAARGLYVPVAYAQNASASIATGQASISNTTITMYITGNGSAWTNSGTKYANLSFAYETA